MISSATVTSQPPTFNSSVMIAICALVFTVASFWWPHARPGRLKLTGVRVFSAYVQPDHALLRVPVTLYNSGAKPLDVVDLRMRLSSAGHAAAAPTKTFRRSVMPTSDDVDDFPHPYVVPGRAVVTKSVEFDAEPRILATGERAEAAIEALITGRGWRSVGTCSIRTDAIGDPGRYITHSSDPAHWPPGQLGKAHSALAAVRSAIQARAT